jgi:hypothetical protein
VKIFGVSQSCGEEREVEVAAGGGGIVLTIAGGGESPEQVTVEADALLHAVTDPAPGGALVEGISPAHAVLAVEVRRNEVWLTVGSATGLVADAAVGLDDFQDGLEAVIGQA